MGLYKPHSKNQVVMLQKHLTTTLSIEDLIYRLFLIVLKDFYDLKAMCFYLYFLCKYAFKVIV